MTTILLHCPHACPPAPFPSASSCWGPWSSRPPPLWQGSSPVASLLPELQGCPPHASSRCSLALWPPALSPTIWHCPPPPFPCRPWSHLNAAASQCLAFPLCLALLRGSPQAAHHPLRHRSPCSFTPPPPRRSVSLGFCSRTSGPWICASSSGCTLG